MNDQKLFKFDWSRILLGAALCLSLQLLFAFIGAFIGLAVFKIEATDNPETLGVMAVLLGLLSCFITFGFGGWASNYRSETRERVPLLLRGLGVWAVATLTITFTLGMQISSSLGNLLKTAGVGAGSAVSATAIAKEIEKLNPRVISDVAIFKGKVISYVDWGGKGPQLPSLDKIADQTKKEAKEATSNPKNEEEIRQAAEKIRKATAAGAGIAALALIFSALGSVLGVRLATPKR